MQVTFFTEKTYPNGEKKITLKNGVGSFVKYDEDVKAKRQITRNYNKLKARVYKEKLIAEYNKYNSLIKSENLERKLHNIELRLNEFDLDNRRRSAQRCKTELYDILKCNDFDFFVTVTFDPDEINRLDDSAVRRAWTVFCNNLHRKYPDMYYVAVPEYHKKGGLHFHLLIGGIKFEDLKPVHAYDEKKQCYLYVTKGVCKGDKIYNITVWQYGFSTMTVLRNKEAAKHYISKYITKQHTDLRFFGKKRYYVSRNMCRPVVKKIIIPIDKCNSWDINPEKYACTYFDPDKQYAVFESRQFKKRYFYGFFKDISYCKPPNLQKGLTLLAGRGKMYILATMLKSLLSKFAWSKKPRSLEDIEKYRKVGELMLKMNQKIDGSAILEYNSFYSDIYNNAF